MQATTNGAANPNFVKLKIVKTKTFSSKLESWNKTKLGFYFKINVFIK
jgi:hypothetical protein